ncbi:MAG TPA: hypothetical protein VMU83_12140 [Hanamia sp.]|nr:hypothetical protein [Hanamia sp.]
MIQNKLFYITIILLISVQFSYGQKTEINFNVYSGLFSFRGDGATSNSLIISYPFIPPLAKFTENPYGRGTGFSYALGLQGQRLSKRKNIYGLEISFEELTSKVNIDRILISGDFAEIQYPASGETKLKNTFITLNPFVGHRYSYHKITIDLLAGFDLAFCMKSKEDGNATATTSNIGHFNVENQRTKPSIDLRPRIQIKTQINKFGFLAGYSLGLTNYSPQYNSKAYTSFLQLGLSYQLK